MPLRKPQFELSPRLRLGVGRGYTQNNFLKIAAVVCLVLAVGLTINSVRLIFKGKAQQVRLSEQVLGASDDKSGLQNSLEFVDYKVVKGDTLFNISQKFSISWSTLATLNNLKSPYHLKTGQVLKVPKQ